MTPTGKKRFFFVHVMKTGGTSFADILSYNFDANERYPDACVNADADLFRRIEAYIHAPTLVADVNARADTLRMVRGHVPYAVRDLLHQDYVAMTILRDPVERTLSYLKHCRRYHGEHNALELEAIYEDEWFFETFMHNYQTKLFSLTPEESRAERRCAVKGTPLPSLAKLKAGQSLTRQVERLRDQAPGRFTMECFAASTGVVKTDEARLRTALDNLSRVEVIGVTEGYERFLTKLANDYGWTIKRLPRRHVGETGSVSPDLIERIARDNSLDMALYERARTLAS